MMETVTMVRAGPTRDQSQLLLQAEARLLTTTEMEPSVLELLPVRDLLPQLNKHHPKHHLALSLRLELNPLITQASILALEEPNSRLSLLLKQVPQL